MNEKVEKRKSLILSKTNRKYFTTGIKINSEDRIISHWELLQRGRNLLAEKNISQIAQMEKL